MYIDAISHDHVKLNLSLLLASRDTGRAELLQRRGFALPITLGQKEFPLSNELVKISKVSGTVPQVDGFHLQIWMHVLR